jgi:hypothetical protein
MAVIARLLDEGGESWEIIYDTEIRQLLVGCGSEAKRFSINDFLAQERGPRAQLVLESLILDMFPNTPEDADSDQ